MQHDGRARDLMIAGLKNAYGLEQQAIAMLEANAKRLENYPALRERIAAHAQESRRQQERVAETLERYGESPSQAKAAVMGFAESVQAMVHSLASDEVLKNSFTGYAFEHFEIASYRALAEMAKAAGEQPVVELAQAILREEEEMAAFLADHLPEVVRRHIETGHKA
ncbi:MAG TPA: ferritin-like domain-containing protein [Beijerinckiaceae bacterium]|nr:ferritin-like domain-containing protein [Beijerinckiaceae bacterium]